METDQPAQQTPVATLKYTLEPEDILALLDQQPRRPRSLMVSSLQTAGLLALIGGAVYGAFRYGGPTLEGKGFFFVVFSLALGILFIIYK